jgi:hypothetical protein
MTIIKVSKVIQRHQSCQRYQVTKVFKLVKS